MRYHYAPDRCKVNDRQNLKRFREERKKWITWLHGPIRQEITNMMTDDVLFRTINEARRLAVEQPKRSVEFNALVVDLFDKGFATAQLMAIRRLVDRSSGVISLHRLISDITQKRDLITREAYVAYDGLPYDYEPVKARYVARVPRESEERGGPVTGQMPSKGPKAWLRSERLHRQFDKLSGKSPSERQRIDLINKRNFRDLNARLKNCANMEKTATEAIAHIPDTKRRPSRARGPSYDITLKNIEKAQRALCEIVTIIDGPLLWESSWTLVAMPQFNQLANLDKAWATKRNLRTLQQFWDEREREIESWTRVGVEWP